MTQNSTTEQLAEDAADVVLRAHGFHDVEGVEILASNLETLGWALGERIPVEQGLLDLVKAAAAMRRRQLDEPISVLVDAAQKRSDELTEYVIPAANIAADGEEVAEYQAEKDRVDAAILALTEGK